MPGAYIIVAIGFFAMLFALVQIRRAKKNGYIERNTGIWVPPTNGRSIKKYVRRKYAICIGGAFIVLFGVWAVVSPQTLLALLQNGGTEPQH